MAKFVAVLLLGIMLLTPALVAAQTSTGGTGATGSGSSAPSGSSGATGSGSGSSSSGSSASPSSSGTSPSASPTPSSGATSGDFSQYTNQADCEKAGGMWQSASNKCAKK